MQIHSLLCLLVCLFLRKRSGKEIRRKRVNVREDQFTGPAVPEFLICSHFMSAACSTDEFPCSVLSFPCEWMCHAVPPLLFNMSTTLGLGNTEKCLQGRRVDDTSTPPHPLSSPSLLQPSSISSSSTPPSPFSKTRADNEPAV